MTEILDKYFFTAVLLLTAAATFVTTPLIFSQGDFVTSLFVVSGLACAILGSFMVMFSGNEPLDPHLIGLLPVQVCLNLCRIASDSGINGNACFLPSRLTGDSRVLQFNPASEYPRRIDICDEIIYRRKTLRTSNGSLSGSANPGSQKKKRAGYPGRVGGLISSHE